MPLQVSIDLTKSFSNRAHSKGTLNLLIFYMIVSYLKTQYLCHLFLHNFIEAQWFQVHLESLCGGKKLTREKAARLFFKSLLVLVQQRLQANICNMSAVKSKDQCFESLWFC